MPRPASAGWLALALAAGAPTIASAGCDNDMDCKGDRICVDAECVDPGGSVAAAPGSSTSGRLSEVQVNELDRARGQGVTCLAGGAGVLVFGAAAVASNDSNYVVA